MIVKRLIFGVIWIGLMATVYFYASKLAVVSIGSILGDMSFFLDGFSEAILLTLAGLSFGMFAMFAADWRIVYPGIFIAGVLAFLFVPISSALPYLICVIIVMVLSFVYLEHQMKTYLNFDANAILKPLVYWFGFFMAIIISFGYFNFLNSHLEARKVTIPDQLLDAVIGSLPGADLFSVDQSVPGFDAQSLNLTTPEALVNNLSTLKESGQSVNLTNSVDLLAKQKAANLKTNVGISLNQAIKAQVQNQIDSFIAPYTAFLPILGAGLLFLTIISLLGIISWFLWPLIALIFWILEKSRFIHFEKEMRQVKKLVV